MLKLNAKDLVKRAQQLADIENSEFISWNENIQLLNEAFQKVYQKVINHDDKTYLKKVKLIAISSNEKEVFYDLPDDFYQLYSLNDFATNRCIVRNTLNDPVNTSGYSIENNQLIIRGVVRDMEMKYFPVCPTITLKADKVKGVLPADYFPGTSIADVFDTKFVNYNETTHRITAYDLITGEVIKTVEEVTDVEKIIAGRNGFTAETSDAVTFYPWNSTDSFSVLNVITDENKNLWFNIADETVITFIDEYGIAADTIEISEKTNYPDFKQGTIKNRKELYYLEDGTINVLNVYHFESDSVEGVSMLVTTETNKLSYFLDELYMTSSGTLYNFKNEKIDLSVIGINKIDFDTGYGYTLKNGNIIGIFSDTQIDYPNNMFIQFLSYQLAIQYKAKQNQDAPGLIALYTEAENQFYDTIGRDDYGYTRINNVY